MAYDETAAALERMSDHIRFERLAVQLLLPVYADLRPLGGSGDRARDAVGGLYRLGKGDALIATFSLERRWAQKIRRDLARIAEEGWKPERIIAVTSREAATPTQTKLVTEAEERGWKLTIHGQRDLVQRLESPENLEFREEYLGLPRPRQPFFLDPGEMERVHDDQSEWALPAFVGRAADLSRAEERIKAGGLVMIEGPGGIGKTRFALGLARRAPDGVRWYFVPDGPVFRADTIGELGAGWPAIVVVDNAHRRTDLAELLSAVLRRRPAANVVLLSRPGYQRQLQDALEGKSSRPLEVVRLGQMKRSEVAALLREPPFSITRKGLLGHLVQLSEGNPQLALIAGHLGAAGTELHELRRDQLWDGYAESVIAAAARAGGQGEPVLRELLVMIAAVREMSIGDESVAVAIQRFAALEEAELRRCLGVLADAGPLVEQNGAFAIKPDLLSDAVLRRGCFRERPYLDYASLYATLAPSARTTMLEALGTMGLVESDPGAAEALRAIRADILPGIEDASGAGMLRTAGLAKALAPGVGELALELAARLTARLPDLDRGQADRLAVELLEALNRSVALDRTWPMMLEIGERSIRQSLAEAMDAYREKVGGVWKRLPMDETEHDSRILAGVQTLIREETLAYWATGDLTDAKASAVAVAAEAMLQMTFSFTRDAPDEPNKISIVEAMFPSGEWTRRVLETGAQLVRETFPRLPLSEQVRLIQEGLRGLTSVASELSSGFGPTPTAEQVEMARAVLDDGIEPWLAEEVGTAAPPVAAEILRHREWRQERGESLPSVTVGQDLRTYLELIDPHADQLRLTVAEQEDEWRRSAEAHGRRLAEADDLTRELAQLERWLEQVVAAIDQQPWNGALTQALGHLARRAPERALAAAGDLLDRDGVLLGHSLLMFEALIDASRSPHDLAAEWLGRAGTRGRRILARLVPSFPARTERWLYNQLAGDEEIRGFLWHALWLRRPTRGWRLAAVLELSSGPRDVVMVLHYLADPADGGPLHVTQRARQFLRRSLLETAIGTERPGHRDVSSALELARDLGVDVLFEWIWQRVEASAADDDPWRRADVWPDGLPELVRERRETEEGESQLVRALDYYEQEELKWPLRDAIEDLIGFLDSSGGPVTARVSGWMAEPSSGIPRAAATLRRTSDDDLFRERARIVLASSAGNTAAARDAVLEANFPTVWSDSDEGVYRELADRFRPWLEDPEPVLRSFARHAVPSLERSAKRVADQHRELFGEDEYW